MKKVGKYFVAILFIITLLFVFGSCLTANTPPSYQYVQMRFEKDKKELFLIKDYLFNSGYTNFYINEDGKTAFADLEDIKICDDTVIAALQHLKEKGYKDFNKFGDTVEFMIWDGIRDISCGIAFVCQGCSNEIQFVTETRLLEQQEWYYYVADYNKWRDNKTGDGSAS